MPAIYPNQDVFTRGEISPRLHARASLDLYRAALARCQNFLTLPHGGIRKRGGTYFVAEVKSSAAAKRLIPFVFSSEQAYVLELGNLYLRVYAYGARVGTVEVVTPWPTADLPKVQYYQSADQMWLAHPDYPLQVLTRTAHTTWALAAHEFIDGPYLPMDPQGTTLDPAGTANLTALSGTATGTTDQGAGFEADNAFDRDKASKYGTNNTVGFIQWDLSGADRVADAYWVTAGNNPQLMPTAWTLKGDGIVLDSQEAQSGWTAGETRFFEFENTTAYATYRLNWFGQNDPSTAFTQIAEIGIHQAYSDQTASNLVASSTTGINDGAGFATTDIGRLIRIVPADNKPRVARIIARTNSTTVTVKYYGHALPDGSPISRWQLGAFTPSNYAESVTIFEERLALSQRFSAFLSKSFEFDDFGTGEEDDAGMEFRNAGGGQANDAVWITDADGYLLIATTGGVRALSGSGIDEALTPSSFKNRRSRTFGCARIAPIDAGSSFLYVTRSRKAIAELAMNQYGRFTSEDVGQISEHIPKKGVVEIAFQTDPDPVLWFPLDNGELGGYTHQPSQEVRGMHRHRVGGALTGEDWPFIERIAVTPGQDSENDDVWLIVRRTIGGATKRYIELLMAPMEDGALADAFAVDCGLSYSGVATGTVTGLSHLNGETVDALADSTVHKGLTVSGGSVTLPGGDTATSIHVGLPFSGEADTLELDVGGKDGSLLGRRKKVAKVILSVFETDTTGLQIKSMIRGAWESVRIPSVAAPSGNANLFTGNVEIPIDDSWEGMGKITIRHTNPTPMTIRALTTVFDSEP